MYTEYESVRIPSFNINAMPRQNTIRVIVACDVTPWLVLCQKGGSTYLGLVSDKLLLLAPYTQEKGGEAIDVGWYCSIVPSRYHIELLMFLDG